jgi:hypothetical protein
MNTPITPEDFADVVFELHRGGVIAALKGFPQLSGHRELLEEFAAAIEDHAALEQLRLRLWACE